MKHICLVLPSLSPGGMERVMILLAEYFARNTPHKVTLLLMTRGDKFYKLNEKVVLEEPPFYINRHPKFYALIRTYFFLRKTLKRLNPDTVLSFGGKYNGLLLLAGLGLNIPLFVSDRSRPTKSYGLLQDIFNPTLYRSAAGIIAQTSIGKEVIYQKTRHNNIRVIGNPIRSLNNQGFLKENIILNVGRFIKSKNQDLLIEYFSQIHFGKWKLVFLGEGEYMEKCKNKAVDLGISNYVEFPGTVKDVDLYYKKAKIFAFVSTSEGFPNALGEAMNCPLASISFNCMAGPSDLIADGFNGFLVEENDHEQYKMKLKRLMEEEDLRSKFEKNAIKSMEKFSHQNIGKQFEEFIIPQ